MAEGDTVIIKVEAPGVIKVETPDAVGRRLQAEFAGVERPTDAVAMIRADREADDADESDLPYWKIYIEYDHKDPQEDDVDALFDSIESVLEGLVIGTAPTGNLCIRVDVPAAEPTSATHTAMSTIKKLAPEHLELRPLAVEILTDEEFERRETLD